MSASALRLHETVDALQVIEEWILEHEDEIIAADGALPKELSDLFQAAELEFRVKVERVGLMVRNLIANQKGVEEERRRLARREQHFAKAAEGLKAYLKFELERAKETRVEGKLVTVRIQKNSAPSVECTLDESGLRALATGEDPIGTLAVKIIPQQYTVDYQNVVTLWKGQTKLPDGIEVVQGTHLRIA